MGATLQHCCATCTYFCRSDGTPLGACLHPRRRPQTDVWPLVRGRELPCRYDWSRDLWELRREAEPGAVVCVGEVRVWTFHGEPALDELPADLLGLLVRGALDGGPGR
jgi:hypothetical protein